VTNFDASTIRRFSPAGLDLGTFAATGLNAPVGLAFDAAGNLYVANFHSDTIRRFSPMGQDPGNFATGLFTPGGLAFDTAGNLYVANQGSNTIRRFSPAGVDLGVFASSGLNGHVFLASCPSETAGRGRSPPNLVQIRLPHMDGLSPNAYLSYQERWSSELNDSFGNQRDWSRPERPANIG
jgi:DNA-binding beta-propeller fold protein YncE